MSFSQSPGSLLASEIVCLMTGSVSENLLEFKECPWFALGISQSEISLEVKRYLSELLFVK